MRRLAIVMMLLWVVLGIIPAWAQEDTMQLRVAHWSTDASAVDVYANGEVVVKSLAYPTVTGWLELEAGSYDIAITPAGTSLAEAVLGPLNFNLVEGTWVTIAAVGSVEASTLATNVLIENYSPLRDAEFARVSIAHAIDGAPPISMMIDDLTAVSSLAYPGTKGNNDGFFTREVDSGVSDIRIFITNEPDVELASEPGIAIEAGMNYLLAVIGTANAPELLIVASSLDGEVMMVSDVSAIVAEAISETVTEDETTEEATVEPTVEATIDEATIEPTVEATIEPTIEEATIEPTVEPTIEPTIEPTVEPTIELTAEAVIVESEATDEPEAMVVEEPTEEATAEEAVVEPEMTDEPEATEEAMVEPEMTDEPEATEEAMSADESEMSNTIADIVVATEADEAEFSVLLAALMVADESIVAILGDPEADLTVFAPTDEAFVALLEALEIDIDTLLNDTELLNRVLQYHVIEGAVMAETVLTMDGESVPTLLGDSATILITVTEDGVVLNEGINVITTDIVAENGVIHIIDGVLVPETE